MGAGPAGLTVGIYGARSGLRTLVLERMMPGCCVADATIIENYPSFLEGIRGSDLATKLKNQCEKASAEIHSLGKVLKLDLSGEWKRVIKDMRTHSGASVILATGSEHRTLGIPNQTIFQGRGIS